MAKILMLRGCSWLKGSIDAWKSSLDLQAQLQKLIKARLPIIPSNFLLYSTNINLISFYAMTIEPFKVLNYGIGGHYHPHIDIMGDEGYGHYGDSGNNPRLATFLFYLTDVEKGGGTAFINANVLVQPRKGSGVFWWNLDQYGERDEKPRDSRTASISL